MFTLRKLAIYLSNNFRKNHTFKATYSARTANGKVAKIIKDDGRRVDFLIHCAQGDVNVLVHCREMAQTFWYTARKTVYIFCYMARKMVSTFWYIAHKMV